MRFRATPTVAKLGSNIFLNFAGSAWLAVLTVAITPVQVHYLGVEAYGFVALISILQVVFSTLDLGISATVTKVVSSDHSAGRADSALTISTAATLYWSIAVIIAALLWFNAAAFANVWLTRTSLDPATVILGIKIIAVYLGFRWPVAFYTGVISGLQRMDVLNFVKAGVYSLRMLGSVVVLILVPDLLAFLLWFAFSSAVEIVVYAVATHRLMPAMDMRLRFSLTSIKDIWKYSATMNVIALTALVLSQADRIAVTKLLSLEALGYYSIAYNAAIAISLAQSAINGASFPAFSHSHSSNDNGALMMRYAKASELMGFIVALPCFTLVFFGSEILELWINSKVASETAPAMALLALGFFFNAMVSSAYVIAIACGRPSLPLWVNLLALLVYVPTLYVLIGLYGIFGAALAYAGLNFYYFFSLLPLVQAKVLGQKTGAWLAANLYPFAAIGVCALGGMKAVTLVTGPGWVSWIALSCGAALYVIIALRCMSVGLRSDLLAMARKAYIR